MAAFVLLKLLRNPELAKRLGQNARAFIKNKLKDTSMVEETIQFYEHTIARVLKEYSRR